MGEPTDEGIFEVALAVTGVEAEEVEVVRILKDLVSEVGFVRRQRGGEIVRCGTDTQMPIRTDVMDECRAGPAVMGSLAGVPVADTGVGETVEQDEDVSPRQLRSRVLRNWVGVFGGKGAHVDEVALGQSSHAGELGAEVVGEPGNDPGSPPFLALPSADQLPDLPIQEDQLRVDPASGMDTGGADLGLDVLEQCAIPGGLDFFCSTHRRHLLPSDRQVVQPGVPTHPLFISTWGTGPLLETRKDAVNGNLRSKLLRKGAGRGCSAEEVKVSAFSGVRPVEGRPGQTDAHNSSRQCNLADSVDAGGSGVCARAGEGVGPMVPVWRVHGRVVRSGGMRCLRGNSRPARTRVERTLRTAGSELDRRTPPALGVRWRGSRRRR